MYKNDSVIDLEVFNFQNKHRSHSNCALLYCENCHCEYKLYCIYHLKACVYHLKEDSALSGFLLFNVYQQQCCYNIM